MLGDKGHDAHGEFVGAGKSRKSMGRPDDCNVSKKARVTGKTIKFRHNQGSTRPPGVSDGPV